MATTSVVSISADFNGHPLAALGDLIAKRAQYLKGETTESAVTATTINVLSSLRADTKVAPTEATAEMFTITMVAQNAAGWRGHPARRKATPDGRWDRSIHPVNLMHGLTGNGNLYRVTMRNPNLTPGKKSKNSPYYYFIAPNEEVVAKMMIYYVGRILKKESGMARYAIQMSAAKIYSKEGGGAVRSASGASNAFAVAHNAVTVQKIGNGFSSGRFEIVYDNGLRYSKLALKQHEASLVYAFKKAANRTAGIINHLADIPLDERIPTPFPEVVGSKGSR